MGCDLTFPVSRSLEKSSFRQAPPDEVELRSSKPGQKVLIIKKMLDIEKLRKQCDMEIKVQVSLEVVPTNTPVCRCMHA